MTSGGDRVQGPEIRARREQLGLTVERLARLAHVSRRALNYAEGGKAGQTVVAKVLATLDRLEAGDQVSEDEHVLRVEFRPGVWVTVDADNAATLGDLREVEAKIRRIIDTNGR